LRFPVSDNNPLSLILGKDHGLACFPIFNETSYQRLEDFFSQVSPETEINFRLGQQKLNIGLMIKELTEAVNFSPREIAVIGSSPLDGVLIKKISRDLPADRRNRLSYFYTNKII
jgi:hypothetical protein